MEVCRHCHGTGHIRSVESTALHVLRSIEEEGMRHRSAAITVAVPTTVALYIFNQKRFALGEIEARHSFRIYLTGDDTLIPPEMRVERIKALEPGELPRQPVSAPLVIEEEPEEPIAEESEAESFAGYRKAERIFFVDPLDGTREFVARNGEFVVMIGLVDGDRAMAGVIHAPELGVSWVGEVGKGAHKIDAEGTRSPISVSDVPVLSEARVVGSRSHRNPALERTLATLGAHELIALGSAGLKAAAIARGVADAYVAPHYAGKRWDACASDALVTAAGGKLTNANGELFDYRAAELDNDRGIVASNGLLHDAIIERLMAARGASG